MNWQEACQHPSLRDLPFKIELNERGKVLMSPVKVYHSVLQGEIAALLRLNRKDGKILTECAIKTNKGTKVADVAWVSKGTYQSIKQEAECSVAPELCVEVLSSSNTDDEIEEKKKLYFDNGAEEVWICEKNGDLSFYEPGMELKRSRLFPNFLSNVDIDA